MTSRKKITAIVKAAKKYDCAVCLKTGARPPGVMIAESEGGEGVRAWVESVKVRNIYVLIDVNEVMPVELCRHFVDGSRWL